MAFTANIIGGASDISRTMMQGAQSLGQGIGGGLEQIGKEIKKAKEEKKERTNERNRLKGLYTALGKDWDDGMSNEEASGMIEGDLMNFSNQIQQAQLAGMKQQNQLGGMQIQDLRDAKADEEVKNIMLSKGIMNAQDLADYQSTNGDLSGFYADMAQNKRLLREIGLEQMDIQNKIAKGNLDMQKTQSEIEKNKAQALKALSGDQVDPLKAKERELKIQKLERDKVLQTQQVQRNLSDVKSVKDKVNNLREMINKENLVGTVKGSMLGKTASYLGESVGLTDDRAQQRDLEIFMKNELLGQLSNFKGAISDKDLETLEASLPKLGDDESIWNNYFEKVQKKLDESESYYTDMLGEKAKKYSNPQAAAVTLTPEARQALIQQL